MKPSDIYRRARSAFGDEAQMRKLREECHELLLAMDRFEAGQRSMGDVIEELADVTIMVEQARLILGSELVDSAKRRKLDRLAERIEISKSVKELSDVSTSKRKA